MKLVPVHQAVGMVLSHDITEIIPGRFKGPAFRRGQIVREKDIDKLKDLGKEHIAILDLGPNRVHEDEAAMRLARAAAGENVTLTAPSEGRVNFIAECDGVLKVDVAGIGAVNALPDMMLATLHTNRLVRKSQVVAGTRIIPLTIGEHILRNGEQLGLQHAPVVAVKKLLSRKTSIITTGSEVYHSRIQDKFGPVVKEKITALGSTITNHIFVPDDVEMTVQAISRLRDNGAELILITGGMSVDPDDLTPASIRACGAEVISYGAPVLPGAMFMLAYLDDVPIVGLPGCVMYHRTSIFDLVLPRILIDERISLEEITALGHGGLCLNCAACRFPDCGFGR